MILIREAITQKLQKYSVKDCSNDSNIFVYYITDIISLTLVKQFLDCIIGSQHARRHRDICQLSGQ